MVFTQDAIALDVSGWPVVVVTPPPRPVSEAELQDFLDRFDAQVRARQRPFGTVLDLRDAASLTPTQRRMISERMAAVDDGQEQFNRASAFVFSSTLMRGLLTAVLWLRKPSYPIEVFAEPEQAQSWLHEQLAATSLTQAREGLDRVAAGGTSAGVHRPAPPGPRTGPSPVPQSPEDYRKAHLQRLAQLRERGWITEAEYQRRRARLENS